MFNVVLLPDPLPTPRLDALLAARCEVAADLWARGVDSAELVVLQEGATCLKGERMELEHFVAFGQVLGQLLGFLPDAWFPLSIGGTGENGEAATAGTTVFAVVGLSGFGGCRCKAHCRFA